MNTSQWETDLTGVAPGSSDWGWLENLRGESRREMIRRLTLERVREGGLVGAPKKRIPDLCWKLLEAFTIGVAVALTSAWLIQNSGLIRKRK